MKTFFFAALFLFAPFLYAQEADSRFCHLQPAAAAPLLPADSSASAALQQQENRLNEQQMRLKRSPKIYCKQDFRLPADALPAFHEEIARALGKGWQARQDEGLLLWESTSRFWPKKYYALLQQAASPDALIVRSLYAENSNSNLHSYVVFGVAASPFLLVLAFIPMLRRRIQRKKRARERLPIE